MTAGGGAKTDSEAEGAGACSAAIRRGLPTMLGSRRIDPQYLGAELTSPGTAETISPTEFSRVYSP